MSINRIELAAQLNSTGEWTPAAALKMADDLIAYHLATKEEAAARINKLIAEANARGQIGQKVQGRPYHVEIKIDGEVLYS